MGLRLKRSRPQDVRFDEPIRGRGCLFKSCLRYGRFPRPPFWAVGVFLGVGRGRVERAVDLVPLGSVGAEEVAAEKVEGCVEHDVFVDAEDTWVAVGSAATGPRRVTKPRRYQVSPSSSASAYPCGVCASPLGTSRWLSILACALVVLLCAAAVGSTCATCVTSHPGQAVSQIAGSIPVITAPPAVLWDLVFVLAFASVVIARSRVFSSRRASPALLQRFLF